MIGTARERNPTSGGAPSPTVEGLYLLTGGEKQSFRIRVETQWTCVSRISASPRQAAFFGTLAPFFRASERPMAMACLRLVTLPPLPPFPERSLPRFSRRMALATLFPAALPYFRVLDFLRE